MMDHKNICPISTFVPNENNLRKNKLHLLQVKRRISNILPYSPKYLFLAILLKVEISSLTYK